MRKDSATVRHQTGTTNATPKRGRTGTTVKLALEFLADHPAERLTITGLARVIGVSRWTLMRNPEFVVAWRLRQQSQVKGSARRPLAKLVLTYIAHRPGLKATSAEQYRISVKVFGRFLERPALLSDLKEETVTRFISWRLERASQATAKRERGDIVVLWRFAARKRLTQSPPVEGIAAVHVAKRNPIAWTLGEVTKILAACDSLSGRMFHDSDQKRRRWVQTEYTGPECSKWFAAIVLFIYDTGARIGATLKIEPADIDLDRGLVTLRSDTAKTGIEQLLRLSRQTVAAIRDIYDPKAKRVWYWGFARKRLYMTLGSILDRAGLPNDRKRKWHCLRRTCATLTAAAGRRDLSQSTLGHQSEAMTRRYIDARAMPVESAADVLPRPLWRGDSTPQALPESPSVGTVDALRDLSPDQLAALLRLAKTFKAAVEKPA